MDKLSLLHSEGAHSYSVDIFTLWQLNVSSIMIHILSITIQCICIKGVSTLWSQYGHSVCSWLCVNCMNTLWWLCVLSGSTPIEVYSFRYIFLSIVSSRTWNNEYRLGCMEEVRAGCSLTGVHAFSVWWKHLQIVGSCMYLT